MRKINYRDYKVGDTVCVPSNGWQPARVVGVNKGDTNTVVEIKYLNVYLDPNADHLTSDALVPNYGYHSELCQVKVVNGGGGKSQIFSGTPFDAHIYDLNYKVGDIMNLFDSKGDEMYFDKDQVTIEITEAYAYPLHLHWVGINRTGEVIDVYYEKIDEFGYEKEIK